MLTLIPANNQNIYIYGKEQDFKKEAEKPCDRQHA